MANRAKYDNPDTKSTKGVWYDHCDPGKNPYESRYGASWRDHLPAKFATTSIKVLIDHVIEEGNRLFADTCVCKELVYLPRCPAALMGEGGAGLPTGARI